MKFSNGVYAQVTFKKEPNHSYYYEDSQAVYYKLEPHFGHENAADAQGWTEVACVGDWYETDGFEIEMMED